MFYWSGMSLLGSLNMLVGATLFLVLITLAIWAIFRLAHLDRVGRPSSKSPAIEILEQRYARGEIDQAMFEQMRKHLQAT